MTIAAPGAPAAPAAHAFGPANVLIVDDLEVNRDLLARRIQRMGHTIAFAENGRHALDQLRAAPYDLVLLDITMPEMDGYEALERMKADPVLSHVPVVMVSAIDEIESVVRCLQLGADDYLTKPFNPVILKARVESSLAKKRFADQQKTLLKALAREMEIGQRIQKGFLPESIPHVPGLTLAALCIPARQVSGDFYDAFLLASGRLMFVVSDVCDKGVGAALYMALFRSLLRAIAAQGQDGEAPSDTLQRTLGFTNNYIANEHGRDNMFATAFCGILDPATGEFDYVNAGHDAPMLLRRGTTVPERLDPGGPALGMMADVTQVVSRERLHPGDVLLAYSDGLTEAIGISGEMGEQAVIRAVAAASGDAQALIDALGAALAAHVGDSPAHDDVTMMALIKAS